VAATWWRSSPGGGATAGRAATLAWDAGESDYFREPAKKECMNYGERSEGSFSRVI
jgi:hypothetical protein